MPVIRPTLRVIKQLPRDSFSEPAAYDEVSRLSGASSDVKRKIIETLEIFRIDHPLLRDAQSYIDAGAMPDLHRESTKKCDRKVYEVRSREGAAWRGGVVIDEENPDVWWLVYADKHDRFHSTAPDFFKNEHSKFLPTRVDWALQENDLAREEGIFQDEAFLRELFLSMAGAMSSPGTLFDVRLPAELSEDGQVSVSVEFSGLVPPIALMHEEFSQVSLRIGVPLDRREVRDRLTMLSVMAIQPDPDMREQVYGIDYQTLHLEFLVADSQLAQFLVEPESGRSAGNRASYSPMVQHWAGQSHLTRSYVHGEVVQALCGARYVPTLQGQSASALPICEPCEKQQPVAQRLQTLIRRQMN